MNENFINKYSTDYMKELHGVLQELESSYQETLVKIVQTFTNARKNQKKIFSMGNGGSASTASHMACDIGKGTIKPDRQRFKIIALTDNIPTMLAWANDQSYEDVFIEQLKNLQDPGDVVLGISGSGNSMNVVKAIEYARSNGATTIAWTGMGGGKLKDVAEINMIVPSDNMQIIEDVHMILSHMISAMIRDYVSE